MKEEKLGSNKMCTEWGTEDALESILWGNREAKQSTTRPERVQVNIGPLDGTSLSSCSLSPFGSEDCPVA